MINLPNRWTAFLLIELGVVVALVLFVCFGINSPKARTSLAPPFASAGTAPDTVEETVTLTTADLKTWAQLDHAYPSNTTHWPCGLSARGLGAEGPPAGQMLVGYHHFFDSGTDPFPCQERIDHWYRGTVQFDLSRIVAKAPPLHVSVKSATLNFSINGGEFHGAGGAPLNDECPGNQLLIATQDWTTIPDNSLPPGDPFIELNCGGKGVAHYCTYDVTKVVNNWVRGADHEGYTNNGFVLRGNNETNSEDNNTCLTRYGGFSLKVTYKYDRDKPSPIFPTETPTPKPAMVIGPVGRAGVGGLGDAVSRTNVALAANGGVATASSVYPGATTAYVNDGDRKGLRAWASATPTFPQWLQIDFAGAKSIAEIDVFTVQDNFSSPAEPTQTMTFSQYGLTGFEVQYWDGSAFVTIPSCNGTAGGCKVSGNNLVWRQFKFPAIITSKIRILCHSSPDSYSRVVQLEAWTP